MKKHLCLVTMISLVFSGTLVGQIDGTRTSAGDNYGAAVSVQQVQTQFGDNFSELNAAYAYNDSDNLYLMLTGNLEGNFNKINIFIDSVAGGENVITPDTGNGGNNPTNDGWAGKYAGLTFDAGFEADYMLICRNGNAGGDRFDFDFSSVGNDSVVVTALDVFGGTLEGSNGMLANGVTVGFDNSNVAGIMGGTAAADMTAALAVETGIELLIPLSEIGASVGDTIKVAVHLNGSNHDFLSNQMLGPLVPLPNQGNLGGDGLGNFTGDLSLIDFTGFTGDQFFSVNIVSGSPTVVAPTGFQVISGTLASGGVAELAESDNAKVGIRRSSTDIQSRTVYEISATSPVANPSTFDFTLEASVFARSNVVQSIELWNYDDELFEEVDSRNANRFGDLVTSVSPTGDLGRFVSDADSSILARIGFRSTNPRQQFSSNTDQTIWEIE